MKKQTTNQLAFNKSVVTELNNNELKNIAGGKGYTEDMPRPSLAQLAQTLTRITKA